MTLNRKDFDELICSLGTPSAEWDTRFRLLRYYDYMHDRVVEAEADRNAAQLKVEELRENFKKQNTEVVGLRANLSYEKETNRIIGKKLGVLEKAEAVWIHEAQLLREALQKATDAAIEAEAKAEKYYLKVRELEIALQLNCKMEPPTTLLWEFEKADNAHELAEAESKIVRLQSLLHSAVAQADATYEPYRKMVQDAREVGKATVNELIATRAELLQVRVALHNLVEACHRADNDGELASAIDGKLMDEAWRVLK